VIEIEVNAREIVATLESNVRKAGYRAAVRAANRTISAVRTRVLAVITDSLGLKKKDAAKAVFVRNATRSTEEASLTIRSRGIALSKFSPRKVKVDSARGRRIGVSVSIKGVRQLVPGGFLVSLDNGKTGIFERKGADRLPIRQLFSSPIAEYIRNDSAFLSGLQQYARETYVKNFEKDFEFFKQKMFGG
jgi:hypothetical protein